MQESMYLLLAGQISSIIAGEGTPDLIAWSYADLRNLRPQIGDSSWRGAMSKARKSRWVQSRDEKGISRFQLTKYGKEQLMNDFLAFQQLKDSSVYWTLLILLPQEGVRQQYAQLQRELEQSGAAQIISSVYAWPREQYSVPLVRQIEQSGFIPSFFPVDPRRSKPFALDSLWHDRTVTQNKKRKIQQISRDCGELLVKLKDKKRLNNKEKERIGSCVLSGIQNLSLFQWFELDFEYISSVLSPFSSQLDSLAREYYRYLESQDNY